jgi:hypothetical protein
VDQPRPRFNAAVLDRLTAALSEHVGPGACVVVAKAAEQSLDVNQLCMSLRRTCQPCIEPDSSTGCATCCEPANPGR